MTDRIVVKNKFMRNLWIILVGLMILVSCTSTKQRAADRDFSGLLKKTEYKLTERDTRGLNEKAKDYFIRGSNLQQEYRNAEAILEFQQALRYDTSAAIYFAIAKNYQALNKNDLALEYVLKSLDLSPDFLPSIELLANIYIFESKFDDAIIAYKKIISLDPSFENKVTLGRIYEINNDYKEAINIYESLLQNGEDQRLLIMLANLYEKAGDDYKYLNTLEKIYDYSSAKDRIAMSLFEKYFETGQYDKAIKLLGKLDKDLPSADLSDSYAMLGSLFYKDTSKESKKYISAYLDKLDNRFRMDEEINFLGGYLSAKIDDTVRTDYFMNIVLNLADTIPEVPLEVGMFYFNNKRLNKSLSLLEEYQPKFPEDSRFPLYIATVYNDLGKSQKALGIVNKRLETDSLNFNLWVEAAVIYDQLGIHDSSDGAYEKALELNPKDPLVNNNYAYSLSQRGVELDRALEMANTAIAAEPNNSSYLDTYGWIQYKLGNYETALEYIQKAIENGDGSYEVYEHLGEVYHKMGQKEKAMQAWNKSLELKPDNEKLKERIKNN